MNKFERIIFVDDSEADNVFHEIMCRRAGFKGEILCFDHGEDALAFFRADHMERHTCIFLDINMPGMDGFEVAAQATPLLLDKPTVMLIMLTSSSAAADRERAATIPIIKGYVTKPLLADNLQPLMAQPL